MIKTCQLIMSDASLKTNIEAEPTDIGNTKEIFETIVKIKPMSQDQTLLQIVQPFKTWKILLINHSKIWKSRRKVSMIIGCTNYRELYSFPDTRQEMPGIIAKEFSSFKEKTEIEFAALRAKLSKQNDIIYNSEQKLYKLTKIIMNENLHLKSRMDDLEKKVPLKDKSASKSTSQKVNNLLI